MYERKGIVYLVGAGPGDPGLITIRGLQLIKIADVVVYDQLGAPAFLFQTKAGAELIDVGKRSGKHTLPQEEINKLLVVKAKEGKIVVRLKGGDSMIFGRGGEELETLFEAGVGFEVVPGITSAIAGPTYAGIPVTHRSCTQAVTFVTGHEAGNKENSTIPWKSLAGIGTVVFLMGVKQLKSITSLLIEAGRLPQTPAAIIQRATSPMQRTYTGTLGTISDIAQKKGVTPPALIVVGDVVAFQKQLSWFEKRPLFGRTIVVTRSRAHTSDLCALLEQLGARTLSCPTIRIERISPNPAFDSFLDRIETFRHLVFSSVNGVEGFFENLIERKRDARILYNKKIICIGPATAEGFTKRGIIPDFIPETYVAESLLPYFKALPPEPVAVLRAEKAREMLPQTLMAHGFSVEVVPLYSTLADKPEDSDVVELLQAGNIDAVTFTSSSTVERFLEMIEHSSLESSRIPAIAIGPVTAETCTNSGINLLATADTHTIVGLVDTILKLFGSNEDGETHD